MKRRRSLTLFDCFQTPPNKRPRFTTILNPSPENILARLPHEVWDDHLLPLLTPTDRALLSMTCHAEASGYHPKNRKVWIVEGMIEADHSALVLAWITEKKDLEPYQSRSLHAAFHAARIGQMKYLYLLIGLRAIDPAAIWPALHTDVVSYPRKYNIKTLGELSHVRGFYAIFTHIRNGFYEGVVQDMAHVAAGSPFRLVLRELEYQLSFQQGRFNNVLTDALYDKMRDHPSVIDRTEFNASVAKHMFDLDPVASEWATEQARRLHWLHAKLPV